MKIDPAKPYADLIKLLIYVAICGFFFWIGGIREEAANLKADNKLMARAVDERDQAIKDRNKAQAKADKLAKLPPKVVTVVRNNPSNCTLPRPVTDSVRDQVRETNSAIRSMR
jgi:hypothetical protein